MDTFTLKICFRGAFVYRPDDEKLHKTMSVLAIDAKDPIRSEVEEEYTHFQHPMRVVVDPDDVDLDESDFGLTPPWVAVEVNAPTRIAERRALELSGALAVEQPASLTKVKGKTVLEGVKLSWVVPAGVIVLADEHGPVAGRERGALEIVGEDKVPGKDGLCTVPRPEEDEYFCWIPAIWRLHAGESTPELRSGALDVPPPMEGVSNRMVLADGRVSCRDIVREEVEFVAKERGVTRVKWRQAIAEGLLFETEVTGWAELSVGLDRIRLSPGSGSGVVEVLISNEPLDFMMSDNFTEIDYELNYLAYEPGKYTKRFIRRREPEEQSLGTPAKPYCTSLVAAYEGKPD